MGKQPRSARDHCIPKEKSGSIIMLILDTVSFERNQLFSQNASRLGLYMQYSIVSIPQEKPILLCVHLFICMVIGRSLCDGQTLPVSARESGTHSHAPEAACYRQSGGQLYTCIGPPLAPTPGPNPWPQPLAPTPGPNPWPQPLAPNPGREGGGGFYTWYHHIVH